MNNMEYLQKISSDAAQHSPSPTKPKNPLTDILSPKIIRLLIIAIAAFIVIIIAGILLTPPNNGPEYLTRINLRCANLSKTADDYSKYLKSSDLRSMNSTLISTLTSTQSEISSALSSYGDNANTTLSEAITTEETNSNTQLNTSLENARLNGLLDRIYANELALHIGYIISLEIEASSHVNQQSQSALNTSKDNLTALYDKFNSYSNTTN